MIGAIAGDIIGSVYEFNNIKTKFFPLWSGKCKFTDDSVMTCAVYKAIKEYKTNGGDLENLVVNYMQTIGRKYPYCGYGSNFMQWLLDDTPRPYGSFGNGSAMRVSAAGWLGEDMDDVTALATASAKVTHDHPEGIKGAVAVSQAIFLARLGMEKEQISAHLEQYYDLNFTLDSIRDTYTFNETCQKSVPQAIVAFMESIDFEDAVRNAVSIGGDSDTIAAITGSIAEAYYGVPADIQIKALEYLDADLAEIIRPTLEQ